MLAEAKSSIELSHLRVNCENKHDLIRSLKVKDDQVAIRPNLKKDRKLSQYSYANSLAGGSNTRISKLHDEESRERSCVVMKNMINVAAEEPEHSEIPKEAVNSLQVPIELSTN